MRTTPDRFAEDVSIPCSTLAEAGAALAIRPYVTRGVRASEGPIRTLVVENQRIVRRALRALLARAAPDVIVAGEASTAHEAAALVLRVSPDVVVMDTDHEEDPEAALRELTTKAVHARVLVLSTRKESEQLLPLLASGARGYLGKDAAEQELLDALRVVASGDVYVRPVIARALAHAASGSAPLDSAAPLARYQLLSERERAVLRLVAEGFNGPEIGRQLGIVAKTVDTYKQRIEEKLGIAHRTAYVRFAMTAGLLRP